LARVFEVVLPTAITVDTEIRARAILGRGHLLALQTEMAAGEVVAIQQNLVVAEVLPVVGVAGMPQLEPVVEQPVVRVRVLAVRL